MSRVLLLILIILSACYPAPTVPPNTGIEGQVFVGPTCPVVKEGQDCADKPYQATLVVLTPGGEEVTRFQTDENGKFRVNLPSGDYILYPKSPKDSSLPYASEQPFTVTQGAYTLLTVNYDSGIR